METDCCLLCVCVCVCVVCGAGEPHICQNLSQFGHGKGTIYGGCSEYTIVPAKYAYLLQTDIDDSKAAILERKSTVYREGGIWEGGKY